MVKVTSTLIIFCAMFQPLMAVGLSPALIRTLIPASFPDADKDPSNYTIRYLSQLNGNDSTACLENQLHSAADDVKYCMTLRYSLTGGTLAYGIRYLILIVSSETYVNKLTVVLYSFNIILVKNPLQQDEAVIQCEEYSVDTPTHSLYIIATKYFALIGVTFSHCGPSVIIAQSVNVTVDGCTFK